MGEHTYSQKEWEAREARFTFLVDQMTAGTADVDQATDTALAGRDEVIKELAEMLETCQRLLMWSYANLPIHCLTTPECDEIKQLIDRPDLTPGNDGDRDAT